MSEYKCEDCGHYESDHDPQDKGECLICDKCKGLL